MEKFKKRHGISCKKLAGEAASVPEEIVIDWKRDRLPEILQGYSLEDVYNFDETGLFYRCTPDKTLEFVGKECHDGKKSKERLTVGLGVNCTGTDKLEPIVIGKSLNPRCFKNVKSLPVEYDANKTAWMTSEICLRYFEKLNERMDSCPAHPKDLLSKLQNIEFAYFPVNTTSRLQPLDLGIIQNVKLHYKNELVDRMVDHLDLHGNLETFQAPTVLDAIMSISNVWNNLVKVDTVRNCFIKAGFEEFNVRSQPNHETGTSEIDLEMIENDALLDFPVLFEEEDEFASLKDKLLQIQKCFDFNLKDFLNADNNLATSGMLSDVQILGEIQNQFHTDQGESECLENIDHNDLLPQSNASQITSSSREIKTACDILEKVALTNLDVPTDIFHCIQKLKNFAKSHL